MNAGTDSIEVYASSAQQLRFRQFLLLHDFTDQKYGKLKLYDETPSMAPPLCTHSILCMCSV